MRQPRTDADGLSQPNGASTTNGNDAVRVLLFSVFKSFACDMCGRMHGGFGENASHLALQQRF